NVVTASVRQQVVMLATTRYHGFNHQHLTEMLVEREQIELSRPTVHRILKEAGVVSPRKRRPAKARRRRDRFPREGMLLQVDGSWHDWLEGRGPYLSLVGAIDDATGLVPWACFREREDAQGYFEVLRATVQRKGVPLAIYSDRHGIFFKTKSRELSLEEQLAGRRQPTQFARLLEELGIQLILARSPQARGTVELHQRFDGTLAVYYEGTCLTQTKVLNPAAQRIHENLGPDAHRVPPQPRPVLPSSTPKSPQRPSPDHPWKRSFPDRRNRTKLLSS